MFISKTSIIIFNLYIYLQNFNWYCYVKREHTYLNVYHYKIIGDTLYSLISVEFLNCCLVLMKKFKIYNFSYILK